MVNSFKHKSPEDTHPAKNIKKARRGEANHYPSQPSSETPESLEQDRTSLLTEIKKRNNEKSIREKMAKTFGYRRQEVVDQKPSIEDIMARWPALFQMEEINAEFLRVTAVPLQARFMAQLDRYSTQLLQVIRKKGGATREKTAKILQFLDQAADVDIKRECVLKSLAIYLGERVEDLIKEFLVSQGDQAEQELQSTIMAIFIIREDKSLLHKPKDIGIVIDGVEVLNELPSVPAAVAMLFGLIYALNMEYPKGFKFTFEAIQKILMELGSNKMSSKINRLSSELHDWK
ncbi:hypothetical protein SKAU_G00061470 [Synaphobranchus kaupii]|uniref:Uncharacterized protein n=1 Tax=Synaphobranchus kaupii TaxID=118154 RepID=A0A9Q1G5Y7_SYNKA|nr:hypothetical protein SKAU_G00061470 [Synaphobranchus kaupii]